MKAFKDGCLELVNHLKIKSSISDLPAETVFNHFLELKPFFDAMKSRDLGWVKDGPEWIREYAGTELDDTAWSTVDQLILLVNLLGMIPEGMRQQVDQMSQMLMDTIGANPNVTQNMETQQNPEQAAKMMENLQSVLGMMSGAGPANPGSALLNMLGGDLGSTGQNRRSRRAASRSATHTRLTRKLDRRRRRTPRKPDTVNPPEDNLKPDIVNPPEDNRTPTMSNTNP